MSRDPTAVEAVTELLTPSPGAAPRTFDAIVIDLERLIREAASLVMSVYHRPFAVKTKADASPVTEADERAEACIADGLRRLAPSIPVIGEEAASAGRVLDGPSAGRAYWLVDPLDGTREFVARNGEFTLNIGLVVDGRPRLGLLLAPVPDILWAGGPGLGAWRELRTPAGAIDRHAIHVRDEPAGGLCLASSRSHDDPQAVARVLGERSVGERLRLGSSWKFGLIAAGEADCYVRPGRTMEWDTAAGHAVLAGAGGDVRALDGTALRYGKPGWAHDGFAAWARPPRLESAPG